MASIGDIKPNLLQKDILDNYFTEAHKQLCASVMEDFSSHMTSLQQRTSTLENNFSIFGNQVQRALNSSANIPPGRAKP